MKHLILAVVATVLAFFPLPGAGSAKRAFDVRDSIEMSRFSNLTPSDDHSLIGFSPNRKHFAVVTSRGIIASDQIESKLWVYSADAVDAYLHQSSLTPIPTPRLVATVRTVPKQFSYTAYSSTITNVQWSKDSRSIYFLGQSRSGNRRLTQAFLNGSRAIVFTPDGEDVVRYTSTANTVVYLAVNSTRQRRYLETIRGEINRDSFAPNSENIAKILFPYQGYAPQMIEVWTLAHGKTRHISDSSDERPEQVVDDPFDQGLSISPDGRYTVRLRTIKEIPDSWSAYEPAPNEKHLRIVPGKTTDDTLYGVGFYKQFVVTDGRTGKTEVLVQAPVGRYLGYAAPMASKWSPDGRFLLLTNTFLPLNKEQASTPSANVKPCLAAVAEMSTHQVKCLQYFGDVLGTSRLSATNLQDACFIDGGVALTFGESFRTGTTILYPEGPQGWLAASPENSRLARSDIEQALEATGSGGDFTVEIRQDLNVSPNLQVIDVTNKQAVKLWDPNPQLRDVKLGEAVPFRWTDTAGNEWKGGLIKPVDYVPGKRYPLVVQMYTFHEGEFLTDGMAPTAMPARAIASAGMFYLQAAKRAYHTWDPQEAEMHLNGLLSAIDTLEAQGLIDPHKVGVIGFSFTDWYVENELVKAPDRFAAATIAEGADNGYSQYLFWGVANPQLRKQMEAINGGQPFGPNLSQWVSNAPSYHLDQIKAPLRIEAMTSGSLIGEWELYSALRLQQKAVDLIYYPTGQHQLQRPLERLASTEGNVDWFRFWLQDYRDFAVAKRAQYERWERMKRKSYETNLQ